MGSLTVAWYFLLFAIFCLRKVWDQWRSRRNLVQLRARGLIPDQDRAMPWLMATHLAFFVLTPLEILLLDRQFVPAVGFPMLGLLLAATGLRAWATTLLGNSWTSRVAVPQDLQPVVRGPYRLVRHPNYLAMSLELLAMDLIYSAWWSALVVSVLNAWSLVLRIGAEERVLFQVPGYRAAMQDKARLIPFVY
jgi:methyltransferase